MDKFLNLKDINALKIIENSQLERIEEELRAFGKELVFIQNCVNETANTIRKVRGLQNGEKKELLLEHLLNFMNQTKKNLIKLALKLESIESVGKKVNKIEKRFVHGKVNKYRIYHGRSLKLLHHTDVDDDQNQAYFDFKAYFNNKNRAYIQITDNQLIVTRLKGDWLHEYGQNRSLGDMKITNIDFNKNYQITQVFPFYRRRVVFRVEPIS
ncbi:MAG: hypothetical protein ABIC04_01080 [Nanoarchaeota archaeon]